MCIGIPQKVLEIKDKMALVSAGDHQHWLDISAIDGPVVVGDYLLSYQGVAINKVNQCEAKIAADYLAMTE